MATLNTEIKDLCPLYQGGERVVGTLANFRVHAPAKGTAAIRLFSLVLPERNTGSMLPDLLIFQEKLKIWIFETCEISQILNAGNSLKILKEHLCVPDSAHQFETLALD